MHPTPKRLLTLLAGDYSVYRVYSLKREAAATLPPAPAFDCTFGSITEAEIAASPDELIAVQAWYHGQDACAFAVKEGGRILSLCFFWFGERVSQRTTWPVGAHQAKLVQIVTLPEARGRGVAKWLIALAAQRMFDSGFDRLYARVWYTNAPSWRAFSSVGWSWIATVVSLQPFGHWGPYRIRLRRNGSAR